MTHFGPIVSGVTASLANLFGTSPHFASAPSPFFKKNSAGLTEIPTDAGDHDVARLKASGWIIACILFLMFCLIVYWGVSGPSYLDVPPHDASMWHWRRYRIPTALAMALIEAALAVAIVVRDRRRERSEMLLRDSEERMDLAIEAADLGLWRWEADSDRFWITERCRAMFGIPPGTEYSLTAIKNAVHFDDRRTLDKALRKALIAGTVFETQFRVTIGDMQTRWARCRGRPTCGTNGRIVRIAGTIVDISEQMQMLAEMERQRQSLVHLTRVGTIGELSGALAHELNQPLTAILSNAQAVQRMIKHRPIDIEELRGAVADIIDDDSRAVGVIRHLRSLLKNDDSKRESVDMNRLVRAVLALVRNELTVRHIYPIVQLTEGTLPVMGDAVQLQQLLLNLVLNATEAMSGSGRTAGVLVVTTAVGPGNTLQLSVCDNGPGIKSSDTEEIFAPFFSTKKEGLGLGLSISRAIVSGHEGTIRAENNSWEGATFHVFLPLTRPDLP